MKEIGSPDILAQNKCFMHAEPWKVTSQAMQEGCFHRRKSLHTQMLF